MNEIERRIESLERWNRRWQCAAGVLSCVLLLAVAVAANSPETTPEVLRAKRVEVIGPDGKPEIILSAEDRQASLLLSAPGKNNKHFVALTAGKDGANLMLAKHAEAPLFYAFIDDDGSTLALHDGREPSQNPRNIILKTKGPRRRAPEGQASC